MTNLAQIEITKLAFDAPIPPPSWRTRVDLIERPQLCPGVQLRRNIALQKPACLLMKTPLQKPGQPTPV
jgi:hypothetical protein